MNVGPAGVALIKEFETLRLIAYQDGGGVWTIGWGHTRGVNAGDVCTRLQADIWLYQDIAVAVSEVNRCVAGIPLSFNAFDALVSFEFNTGGLRFQKNGVLVDSTLLTKLKAQDYLGAAREFAEWDHDNGKQVAGLTRRRLREQALFLAV